MDNDFSSREQEVLCLLAQWHITDDEIASALKVAKSTAHFHVCKIMRKTGFHDRAHLLRYAYQNGYGDAIA